MNIGFYGKGGSGKTTMSALFSVFLDSQKYKVGLLDADVNSHTASIVGAHVDDAKVLSLPENESNIWRHLVGINTRVASAEYLNTTPPGNGSNHWSVNATDYLTETYGQAFGKQSHVFTVGSYKPESIGNGCHHSTQTVAENMITHAKLHSDEMLIIDSVAGNDAFGTTLFLNDVLVFIVKPEREGIDVLKRFLSLADRTGQRSRVVVVGNQVVSDAQRAFLEREVPADNLIGILDINEQLIERRLDNLPLGIESIREEEATLFQDILDRSKQLGTNTASRYETLLDLHRQTASESWVAGSYRAGLEDQIDPEYQPV